MLKQLMLSFVVLMGFSSASALSIMPHPIEHTNWELSTYNGAPAEGSLSFDDRMMYSRFCNHVSQ